MDKVKKEKDGIHLFLLGTRDELDKIEAAFQWLKINLSIKKIELYKKAFLWIASDEKVREKFIEFLLAEKAKNQILEIKK
jgi:hypothetical protein